MNKRSDKLKVFLGSSFIILAMALFATQEDIHSPFTLTIFILMVGLLTFSWLPTILRITQPLFYFNAVLTIFPQSVTSYIYRAQTYAARQRYDLALQDYNRAIELKPKRADTYIYRGNIYVGRQEYEQAMQDFDRAIALDPYLAMSYSSRGRAYMLLQEPDLAIQDFSRSIELFGFNPWPYRMRGTVYQHSGRWNEALVDQEKALQLSHDKASQGDICNEIGLIYHYMGEYRLAIEHFQHAQVFGQQSKTYNNLGFSYVYLKEYQLALQACNEALKLDPKSDPAYNNRGKAYLGLGAVQQARADFARAVEIDPLFVTHTWYLVWTRLCQEEPGEEMALRLETVARSDDQQAQACNCRGVARWIRGASGDALQEFTRSIQTKPIQWDVYFWQGLVYASLGREQEAREALQTALAQSMPPILLSPLHWVDSTLYQEFAGLQVVEAAPDGSLTQNFASF